MPMHEVIWRIDIEADDPRDAARRAQVIQRKPDSIATAFEVKDERGQITNVDLDAE